MKKLTWPHLEKILPAINATWLEKAAGLRRARLYDCRAGRSSLTAEELERIEKVLRKLLG